MRTKLVIGLGLLAATVAGLVLWWSLSSGRNQDAIDRIGAEMEALGYPRDLDALIARHNDSDPEVNGGPLLLAAARAVPQKGPDAVNGVMLRAEFGDFRVPGPNDLSVPDPDATRKHLLETHRDTLDSAYGALKRDEVLLPIDEFIGQQTISDGNALHALAALIAADGYYALNHGEPSQVIRSIQAVESIRSAVTAQPLHQIAVTPLTVVELGHLQRVLAHDSLPDEVLDVTSDHYRRSIERSSPVYSLWLFELSWRAYELQQLRQMGPAQFVAEAGRFTLGDPLSAGHTGRVMVYYLDPSLLTLRSRERILEVAKLHADSKQTGVDPAYRLLTFSGEENREFSPGSFTHLGIIDSSWTRPVATCRVAIAAIEAVRYEHQMGSWPSDLATLGLSEDEQTDPYTGKDLVWRRLPDGFQVYSSGWSMRDNGGFNAKTGEWIGSNFGLVVRVPPTNQN